MQSNNNFFRGVRVMRGALPSPAVSMTGIPLPPPTLSQPSDHYFLSVDVAVVRPEGYANMTVYYFLNGDDSVIYRYDGDEPFTVAKSQTITLFGRVGDKTSSFMTYDFVIKQPHFIDTMEFSDSVMTVNADSVAFTFNDGFAVDLKENTITIDNTKLTDAINLSFI